jgi:hypothetical protein
VSDVVVAAGAVLVVQMLRFGDLVGGVVAHTTIEYCIISILIVLAGVCLWRSIAPGLRTSSELAPKSSVVCGPQRWQMIADGK